VHHSDASVLVYFTNVFEQIAVIFEKTLPIEVTREIDWREKNIIKKAKTK